jgi:pimeloyl-ACP methyl ester carboxylesterase
MTTMRATTKTATMTVRLHRAVVALIFNFALLNCLLNNQKVQAFLLSPSTPTKAATTTTTTTGATTVTTDVVDMNVDLDPLADFDYKSGEQKLPWIETGYKTWKWKDQYNINYIELGDKSKPAIVLIHGFGASSFHYRYNLPELANDFHVFAFCKLGFGLSDKPIIDYSAEVWRDQAKDFLKEVVQKPAVLAGNSLGGFTSLYTAATDDVKDMVTGVVLMNGAGRFKPAVDDTVATATAIEETKNPIIERIQAFIQRTIIAASFVITKQPARIEQILRQVYPSNADNVDSELVESIRFPSLDPNAAEVFYRVITKNGNGPQKVYIDDLLENLDCPLLLCWGEYDPWIKSTAADKIQDLRPSAIRVSIDAGHCPHDENPAAVNDAIRKFVLNTAGVTA